MFKREFKNEELLVINNFYGNSCEVDLDFDIEGFECILSNEDMNKKLDKNLRLEAYDSFCILQKKINQEDWNMAEINEKFREDALKSNRGSWRKG